MEYYTLYILPSCPIKDNCQCQLENIQETMVVATERHYTIFVSCPDKGLTHFPKLPKHTRTVDLSNNKVLQFKVFFRSYYNSSVYWRQCDQMAS